jgi:hypothetical protein
VVSDKPHSPSRSLEIHAMDGRIVVSMPGTSFRAAYFRSVTEPGLTPCEFLDVDRGASISRKEFEALAWDAAIAKARELGWIA